MHIFKVILPMSARIEFIEVWSRCALQEQFGQLDIEFSDVGSIVTVGQCMYYCTHTRPFWTQ